MRATRRGLLAAAGLAVLPVTRTRAADRLEVLARRLIGLLGRPDSARHIAAAYLAGIEKTNWRRAALDLDMPEVLAPMDRITGTTASRAWLGSRIRADFEAGAVIDVDGWRLSRTEVGACLLVAGVA
jgi:hypothetical protein